ncbi:MAG TPA: RsmG family class I SAM-dependent methyltransferase [Pyrinomonadaceae bacterium]|nr:RsmG family class I SAM-dependent methyltransferase [Pyrinomonadaceae bacterium]
MAERKLTPRDEFDKALAENSAAFGQALDGGARARLGDYFEAVARWNSRLHLVAPCAPAEFATRHALESLVALPHIPKGSAFVDVGSGAGLPAIPCLVAREDLSATLVESSQKKAVYLRETLRELGLSERARVVAERFEKVTPPRAAALTCRALERFTEVLPSLVGWASGVPVLLLFGGETLRERLERLPVNIEQTLIPTSERRFLFVVRRRIAK